MNTPDEDDTPQTDEGTRERSAEQRNITAPTPKDVREKTEGDGGEESATPPAADAQAP